MTLKEYYEKKIGEKPTPKQEFRAIIAESCAVTEQTVFRWLSGDVPDKLKREKLAEITGIPVNELFPNTEELKYEKQY
jgi:hypothetical protein